MTNDLPRFPQTEFEQGWMDYYSEVPRDDAWPEERRRGWSAAKHQSAVLSAGHAPGELLAEARKRGRA